jgi:hypothetical protein
VHNSRPKLAITLRRVEPASATHHHPLPVLGRHPPARNTRGAHHRSGLRHHTPQSMTTALSTETILRHGTMTHSSVLDLCACGAQSARHRLVALRVAVLQPRDERRHAWGRNKHVERVRLGKEELDVLHTLHGGGLGQACGSRNGTGTYDGVDINDAANASLGAGSISGFQRGAIPVKRLEG